MIDDQRDVIDFLTNPSSYDSAVERVEVIETHASLVFLAGDRAYKLKRAVRYPYLDFSTAERRRAACEAELDLNRRTAPELYLEIRVLTRSAQREIAFAGAGPAVANVFPLRETATRISIFESTVQVTRPLSASHSWNLAPGSQRSPDRSIAPTP